MSRTLRFRLVASPLPYRLAWAVLSCVLLGCGGDLQDSRNDPTLELPAAERARLASFINEIRRGYEMGDAGAVEAHINRMGTPDAMSRLTRRKNLPKGPMNVLDVRVEERRRSPGKVVTLDGVDYRFNVEPLGTLVIEMDDVSIGEIRVDLIIGRKDGEFFIAGLQPLE